MMVVQGLRPNLAGDCPEPMRRLIEKCWDGNASNRPCEFLLFQNIIFNNLFFSPICVVFQHLLKFFKNLEQLLIEECNVQTC